MERQKVNYARPAPFVVGPIEARTETPNGALVESTHGGAYRRHSVPSGRTIAALERPYPAEAPMRVGEPSEAAGKALQQHAWAANVFEQVKRAWAAPGAAEVVPTMVVPLFHDGPEVQTLLQSIDSPVRLFVFVWNSASEEVAPVVEVLRQLPYGVVVQHFPDNIGFSGAVNAGIMTARTVLADPPAAWYFIVNADTGFPRGALGRFAAGVAPLVEDHGLAYGPRQDHFAFAITRKAVDTVGYFDEVFYPGYMEDIDFHWRVMLGGLKKRILHVNFEHKRSVNDKKPTSVTGNYKQMLTRASRGLEYGWLKWGRFGFGHVERNVPPSGWRTPFNIAGAPLDLWAIDPGQRECVRTGNGIYFIKSSTCWYNGTVLLAKAPEGTVLNPRLLHPPLSGLTLREPK